MGYPWPESAVERVLELEAELRATKAAQQAERMNTPINREDIRKGDRVQMVFEYTSGAATPGTTTYELINRPAQLPTEPGWYLDKQKDLWRLIDGEWHCVDSPSDWEAWHYAPFVPLRPVADVAAEVLAEVRVSKMRNSDLAAIGTKYGVDA